MLLLRCCIGFPSFRTRVDQPEHTAKRHFLPYSFMPCLKVLGLIKTFTGHTATWLPGGCGVLRSQASEMDLQPRPMVCEVYATARPLHEVAHLLL